MNVSIKEIRELIRTVNRRTSEDIHLNERLRDGAAAMTIPEAMWVEVTGDPEVEDLLTSQEKVQLLHLAREALRNACQHSQATAGWITLTAAPHGISLRIEDHGIGLRSQTGSSREVGLRNMKLRAETIGGTFHFKTAPMQGTQIIVEIPKETGRHEP